MINRLQQAAADALAVGAEALLVLQPENRLYLSGFTGSAGALLVSSEHSWLVTDFRYLEQARQQSPHLEVEQMSESMEKTLAELVRRLGCRTLGFEADYINYSFYTKLQQKVADDKIKLIPTQGITEKNRRVKESIELESIARSMALLDQGFAYFCDMLKIGVSERELALELEIFLRRHGASGVAFPFIVASGPRSSLPHGIASDRVLGMGDLITLDFGVVVDSYNSDMTRTVALGDPPSELKQIYQIVLEAQAAGLLAVRAGVQACTVDAAARKVIEKHGYGNYFGHGTGHGIGLAVHESPRLSAKDQTVLEEGMVVTVEPGIYLPGVGGVRIEDSVVVEKDGCRILTKSPKDQLLQFK